MKKQLQHNKTHRQSESLDPQRKMISANPKKGFLYYNKKQKEEKRVGVATGGVRAHRPSSTTNGSSIHRSFYKKIISF